MSRELLPFEKYLAVVIPEPEEFIRAIQGLQVLALAFAENPELAGRFADAVAESVRAGTEGRRWWDSIKSTWMTIVAQTVENYEEHLREHRHA